MPTATSSFAPSHLSDTPPGKPPIPELPTPEPPTPGKLWRPRRVLITPDALALPHGRAMLDRAASFGAEVTRLSANRLSSLNADTPGKSYALAKTTFAIVVAPPGQRKLQPIPPSADWQFHLAQGCPAHCQYCYLAGSLSGPPITRAYANLPEILEALRPYAGRGNVTSRSRTRAHEGTTFEASCYTDPLAIEHLTGALEESIRFFGAWEPPAEPPAEPRPDPDGPQPAPATVQLRFTTKFDAVTRLLALPHHGCTRVRFSLNARSVSRDFEGGTATVPQRLNALRSMALAGYPVGLTIAPIMPVENWQAEYTDLFRAVAVAVSGVDRLDLTAELITHRFTPSSKEVLVGWYPKSTLDLREEARSEKRTKFGGFKYVYPKDSMAEMRSFFESTIRAHLPTTHILYWT